MNYCNSLLYNTKKAYITRLQRVQNPLCRTVLKLNKYCHVTPFLHKLRWLPIHYRILLKYNLLTYKAIHFSQPLYLSSLIRRSDHTGQSPINFLIETKEMLRAAQLHSRGSHRVEQASSSH